MFAPIPACRAVPRLIDISKHLAIISRDVSKVSAINGGWAVAHELPRLHGDHPGWHVWTSAQGRLYATKPGASALLRGASVTVDSATPEGLSQAIAAAERDARRAVGLWEIRGHGR